jgi:hypothetical protein
MQYQVTLMCDNGKYKPVSTIVEMDTKDVSTIKTKGIQKICAQRYWTKLNLKQYGYTKVKIRAYDKEKIDKENAERYNKIKEEKYASGEWKRPKKEVKP